MGNFWKLGFIALHCISFTLGLVKSYLKKLIPAVPWRLFWYTALVRIKFLDISQKQCIMTKISSSWVNHRPCWGSYIVNLETYLETKCGGLILSIVVFLVNLPNQIKLLLFNIFFFDQEAYMLYAWLYCHQLSLSWSHSFVS